MGRDRPVGHAAAGTSVLTVVPGRRSVGSADRKGAWGRAARAGHVVVAEVAEVACRSVRPHL